MIYGSKNPQYQWAQSNMQRPEELPIVPRRFGDKAHREQAVNTISFSLATSCSHWGTCHMTNTLISSLFGCGVWITYLGDLWRSQRFISSHAGESMKKCLSQQTVWMELAAGGFDWRRQKSTYQRRGKVGTQSSGDKHTLWLDLLRFTQLIFQQLVYCQSKTNVTAGKFS